MKKHKLAGPICALLLTALGASPAVAQTNTASILFIRAVNPPGPGNSGLRLGRVQPSGEGVAWLTPFVSGVEFHGGGWSPGGAAVVYVRSASDGSPSQLHVVNRQGGNERQITTGPGGNGKASWGPNGIIAFVNANNELDEITSRDCLGTVRPDGTQQHIVFCPPHPPGTENSRYIVLSQPQWTPNGNSVLVEAGSSEGSLEPRMWFSDVYRVNVTTGTAVRVGRQVFSGDLFVRYTLAIAPDGTHGVYGGNPMHTIDFATNTLRPISTSGDDPVFSKDGRKVAFDKENSHGLRRVYVMNADGSNIRPALANPERGSEYVPDDWSFDGTRVLVNQFLGSTGVQIIDLRTNTARPVINDTVEDRAWFHR